MRRKKIIHLIQSLDSGGCENMLLRTLPLLADFEHIVITLKNRGELADKFEEKNIKIINIGRRRFFDIASYTKLFKTIKLMESDAVITYLFHADMIGRLVIQLFYKKPVIPFLRTTYNHKKYLTARIFEKITKYFVKNYLANSESVKNFYVKDIGVAPEKITVIPNGIDIAYYDSIEKDSDFRLKLGIKPEETAVICVANLHINKGHQYLLEAFEKVYINNKNIKLLLVGDGEEKEKLQKQIENYKSRDNTLFLGKRSDIPKLLKISDIFILPTLFEGMNNAILEAMAIGLPIITTDIPENRELIKNNETGILIPVKKSDAIYKTLEAIFVNSTERKRLSENAKMFTGKKFTLSKTTNEWGLFLNNHI